MCALMQPSARDAALRYTTLLIRERVLEGECKTCAITAAPTMSCTRLVADCSRLEARRKQAEQAEYDSLIADITQKERKSREAISFLPNARLQMSQGVHVCVSMGLGYAMGAAAGSATSLFGPVTVRLVLACVPLHLVCVQDTAAALLPGQAPAHPQWQPESCKSTTAHHFGIYSCMPSTFNRCYNAQARA